MNELRSWAGPLAWLLAILAAVWVLAAVQYRSRDPDSALYAAIASHLAQQPPQRWIAPEWWGEWRELGLFREHPAGIFWLPALLARAGYPAPQAAYAVNAIFQAMTVLVFIALARGLVGNTQALALALAIQLIPIAFTYRVRANHEQAVLFCFLLALCGTERSFRAARYWLLTAAGLIGLWLVKGIFVILPAAACVMWLLLRGRSTDVTRSGCFRACAGLAAALTLLGATIFAYDWAYRATTGEPFLSAYFSKQLAIAAEPHAAGRLAQKAHNLVWYCARALFFPLPWSVALLVAAWRARRRLLARDPQTTALVFTLLVTAAYLAAFSLSDRKADRYIFPVYTLLAATGAGAWLRRSDRLRHLAERLATPSAPALAFLGLILLHLASGVLKLPRIKVWPSS